MSRPIVLLVALALADVPLGIHAQSSAEPHDLTIQISPAQAWTDTGLDLQPGDTVKISASVCSASSGSDACVPAGCSGAAQDGKLPLPSAPPGALIARLHGEGSVPVLVGAERDLKIGEASHLFLGLNSSANACHGEIAVKIHMATKAAAGEQQSRGQALKSQLSTAAQVFMQGQFGLGKTDSGGTNEAASASASGTATAAAKPSLTISNTPLDPELRKHLDSLPRRVNDQFHNLGDMVNFVMIGAQKDVQGALEAASWHVADTSNTMAAVNAAMQTYGNKDYLAMPMSTLYLFNRKQDFGYELAEPIAMVASRHHFRIWKAPFTWNGREVWAGAGTHDIGFAKDRRNNSVTHKIDPDVDGERENIGSSLQKASVAKSMTYYLPPNALQDAKNATGDSYHSDGRLLVIFLP
jgi:hypothetical protein